MPNTLLTPTKVTRKALMVLHQKLSFIGTIERQYDDQFAVDGAKIGSTLKIRLPNRYVVQNGPNITPQDTLENSVDLVVASNKVVPMEFQTSELTLSLDDFSERIIDPAMAVLGAAAEADAFSMALDVWNQVGTPTSTPNALLTYLQAGARLDSSLAPRTQRCVEIGPNDQAVIVDSLKGLFQDSQQISKQYRDGLMGRTAGFDWYSNTLMSRLTNGNKVAGVTVSGAGQTGSNLLVAGLAAADTFKKGQTFTIAGVFEIHPETRVSTGVLQNFVVTADVTSVGATATLPIAPSIVTTGPLQNVSAGPAAAAALVFVGAVNINYALLLAYYKQAFAIAFADMIMPKGLDFAARETMDGISMRILRDYTVLNDRIVTRVDILYGFKAIRPEFACRIASA